MKSILDKINTEYKNFTPSQQKLAHYFFRHQEDALILNSNQIANKVKVSEATVTRFITVLGFSGFSEFKREIGKQIVKKFSTTNRLTESVNTFDERNSVFAEILKGDIENIQTLTKNISDADFMEAVEILCSARSIYILGLRASYSLAFYLKFYLRFFLNSVKLITLGVDDVAEQVHHIGEGDVLVAICFKRYTREVLNITEKIKKRGTFVLAITDIQLSPIAQLADLSLIAGTKIPTYIESFSAPMSLIGALIGAIAIKKKKKALPALNKLEIEFKEFETFL